MASKVCTQITCPSFFHGSVKQSHCWRWRILVCRWLKNFQESIRIRQLLMSDKGPKVVTIKDFMRARYKSNAVHKKSGCFCETYQHVLKIIIGIMTNTIISRTLRALTKFLGTSYNFWSTYIITLTHTDITQGKLNITFYVTVFPMQFNISSKPNYFKHFSS